MSYIIGFVVLLGVLIFIHELGHFLLAKAVGVRVETFSIGMGHKFLKFTKGETEYALSLIPLGGYVKLTGQDPREEVPKELESRSFRHKTVLQRALVVLAGPLFNAALTVILFFVLYSFGAPSAAPILERVLPGSPAAEAGLQSGDWVNAVHTADGKIIVVRDLQGLEEALDKTVNSPVTLSVERSQPWSNGEKENVSVSVTPTKGLTRDSTLGVMKERGIIAGVERTARAPLLHVYPGSWAAARQVPDALWVERVEFEVGSFRESYTIRSYEEFEKLWQHLAQKAAESHEGQIVLKGQLTRLDEGSEKEATDASSAANASIAAKSYTLAWTRAQDRMPATTLEAGLAASELVVLEIKEETPAAQLGLQKGDEILTLNGEKVKSFQWFKDRLQQLAHANTEIVISWRRGTETLKASVIPQKVSTKDPFTEAKKEQFQIGAAFLALPANPVVYPLKASSFFDAVSLGWSKSVDLSISMLASFYYLAIGDISPKTLGGPILIGKIAGESVKQGWEAFIKMMAFISLNLFILNLLPIPVLDGGHLLLFAIEAIRRKPLSLKVVEIWTTTGFFILMGLIAVVFINDLNRIGAFKIFGL
jgi:regulator of sigma E protease